MFVVASAHAGLLSNQGMALLIGIDTACGLDPVFIDDHMAGSASTGAAAIGVDPGYAIVDGDLHQRLARFDLHDMLCAAVFNRRDSTHKALA